MKNKQLLITGALIILSVLGSFIIYHSFNDNYLLKKQELNDHEKFAREYNEIEKNNIFVYRSSKEIKNILTKGTGIVFLGFPECPWCQRYVVYLNEMAKSMGVKKIYYYNIYNARKNNNKDYKDIVKILKNHLDSDEEGNPKIYVPDITFVKNGKIVAHDNETSMIADDKLNPDIYWTKEQKEQLSLKLIDYISKIIDNQCQVCNK